MRRIERTASGSYRRLPFPSLLETQGVPSSTRESWTWLDDSRVVAMPSQPNLLVQGPSVAIDKALIILAPHLRRPLQEWYRHMPFPSLNWEGTLILHDPETMELSEQRELLQWIEETVGRVQVVTVTGAALFRLVERKRFLDALYYRLNAVYLDVNARQSPREIVTRTELSSTVSVR